MKRREFFRAVVGAAALVVLPVKSVWHGAVARFGTDRDELVWIYADHRELWVIGEETTEMIRFAPEAPFVLDRLDLSEMEFLSGPIDPHERP
jgi:hypothetical protein